MEVSEAAIKRFFENNCTKEEAILVHQYFLDHPEQLDKWLPEREWESFVHGMALSTAESNTWFEHIENNKDKKGARVILRQWVQVAAAVLIAAGFVAIYQFVQPASKKAILKNSSPQIPASTPKIFRNNSLKNVTYVLDDGSTVTLHAKSLLICQQPFDLSERNITLHGEGLFRVAKDKSRPFTVFTKGFSTTALGTTFRIKAYDSSSIATVKLIEGKVVLQNLQHPGKPVYLHPGDAYNFSHNSNSFRSITPKPPVPAKITAPIQVDGSITETAAAISFSNTPLTEVLKKISEVYKITINTDEAKPEGRKFTGSFLKKQVADEVLSTIAELNNYVVVQEGTVYRLTIQ
ncbi:FecR family protein [Pseudoflavitalea sp. X16]|uniref:FecR family protein n=1 Tax=Paraflavitalea devenefica TaxID=2716334 RepID=UPI0014231173|nr:FecR domain-containing protein [Paraflavitalea devenefica]NII24432.1 FecR family protein [Paraflavitalea devenefica]